MIPRFALVLLAGSILGSDLRAQAPVEPRTDFLGDPLPFGAVARLGTLRFKHNATSPLPQYPYGALLASQLTKAVFSSDGTRIATLAQQAPTMRLWEARTGKELPGPWSTDTRAINGMTFSADGKILAAVGGYIESGIVARKTILWNVAEAKLLRSFAGPPEIVQAMVFAQDGKTLITAGAGNFRWWDVATGKEQRSWKPFADEVQGFDGGKKTKVFNACVFSPGAKFLTVGVAWRYNFTNPNARQFGIPPEDNEAVGFDLDTRKTRWRTRGKLSNGQMQFAFSADEKRVALAIEGSKVELRDTVTGKLIDIVPLEPPSDPKVAAPAYRVIEQGGLSSSPLLLNNRIGALAMSSDGTQLAIGGVDSQILLWDPAERTKFRRIAAKITQMSSISLRCLAFSPDDRTLLAGADADVQLYDTATLKEVVPWEGHRGWVDYLTFSTDGNQLLSGSAMTNLRPNEVVTWDTATWKSQSVTSIRLPKWPNIGVSSPEHTAFAGKDGEDRLRIYDQANGKLLGRLAAGAKQNAGALGFFSPGSKFYVLAGQNDKGTQIARLFAIPSCKLLCELPALTFFEGSNQSGRPIAFSADGRLVAIIGQNQLIRVCETNSGKVRHRLGRVAENNEIVQLRIWVVYTPDLAFSPDGNLLASWTANDQVVRVWEMSTGKERLRLPFEGEQHVQMHFAWSPDGRTLAAADRKIQLLEAATGNLRREFESHEAPVRSLSFSPDGRFLASGSADTTVLVWNVWGR